MRNISPPIIARKIRLVPYSPYQRTVCMRVELYGCTWRGLCVCPLWSCFFLFWCLNCLRINLYITVSCSMKPLVSPVIKMIYRVAHKVDHFISSSHVKNFCNISTVTKTLTKMLFTLRCNNWSQSFLKMSNCPISQITCSSVTSWMTVTKKFNANNIAKSINSLSSVDPISGIYILQELNHCWATIYVNYIHRLHGGPLFSVPLCICV